MTANSGVRNEIGTSWVFGAPTARASIQSWKELCERVVLGWTRRIIMGRIMLGRRGVDEGSMKYYVSAAGIVTALPDDEFILPGNGSGRKLLCSNNLSDNERVNPAL